MRNKAIIITVLASTALLGCKPTSDKVPKADEPSAPRPQASAPRSQTSDRANSDDRTVTQQKLSQELNDLDKTMADLKARAQRAGDQAKAEWETRRPQLEAQRDDAAKKLDELKQASKETWDQTRTKAEAAFSEVEKGFKEAWSKLKE
jgi:chromosome segregation ATPase